MELTIKTFISSHKIRVALAAFLIYSPFAFGDGTVGNSCQGSEDTKIQNVILAKKELHLLYAVIDGQQVSAETVLSFAAHNASAQTSSLADYKTLRITDEMLNETNNQITYFELGGDKISPFLFKSN